MMLRRLPITLLCCLTALLGACHSVKQLVPPNFRPAQDSALTLAQAKQKLQQATPCCGSFADFSYQTPLPWRPQKFELGSSSPVASLNGVRSYFLNEIDGLKNNDGIFIVGSTNHLDRLDPGIAVGHRSRRAHVAWCGDG